MNKGLVEAVNRKAVKTKTVKAKEVKVAKTKAVETISMMNQVMVVNQVQITKLHVVYQKRTKLVTEQATIETILMTVLKISITLNFKT
jgi:hypothetical protein